MRIGAGVRLGGAMGIGLLVLPVACKNEPSRLDQLVEASTLSSSAPSSPPPPLATTPPPPDDAGPSDAGFVSDGSMPPRPIPKPALTVGSGEPADVQLKAIAYMAAMEQPRIDDAPADKVYANNLAAQLRPIASTLDNGTPDDKLRLNRVEVVASGRRIDLLMADGCDAQLPGRAVQRASAPLFTLLSHGVLVIRCNDAHVQCLQSTRDAADILCTTAPRHR